MWTLKIEKNNFITIIPQEDEHFIDETITSSINYISNENINKKNSNCCSSNYNKIIRKDIFLFTLNENNLICPKVFLILIAIACGIFLLVFQSEFDLPNFLIVLCFGCLIPVFLCISFGFIFEKKYLVIEQNSIIINKIALFRKKTIVYKMGELERAEICYKYNPSDDDYYHRFNLYFVKKDGKREIFCYIRTNKVDEDLKGVKYFIDLLNQHIFNNMN